MQLPVKLHNGEEFFVEVEGAPGAAAPADDDGPMFFSDSGSSKSPTALAEKQFAGAVRVAQGIATEVTEGLINMEAVSKKLADVTLELSLGFGVSGNVFVAQGNANAALKLTLHWALK